MTDLFDFMDSISATHFPTRKASYPPYNLVLEGDDKVLIELAVSGFRMEELSIVTENRLLTVSGQMADAKTLPEDAPDRVVIHRGIAARAFKQSWKLHSHLEVEGASLENGLLTITLKYNVPEALKPRAIEIK